MNDDRELPEGVIDADPPGGFESADAADDETAERSAHAVDSALLSESRLAPDTADPRPATPDVPVESDQPGQVGDADLSADDGNEEP